LLEQGCTEASVTIDNEDYLFAKACSSAHNKKNEIQMNRIGSDYIKCMEAKVHYYDQLSTTLFDRKIPQILLIHASLLNADYVGELAKMYQRNGSVFVDLPTALRDTAYQEKVTKFGSYGISWVERWIISRSVPKGLFANDPKTPVYIVDSAR
jgi:hypothetical protein